VQQLFRFHINGKKDKMKAIKENQRVSNKDQKVFDKIIKFYGKDISQQEEYLAFIENFKNLRGDYGFKKDNALLEKIHPDVGKLHKELMARPKLPDTSHGMFLKTADYNKSLRKLTKAEEEAL
jgi:hypothetical protein|tara:strand:- start:283 stop:651 length:369 start_codon:yes stop_codon:yes gene_type:complete